MTLFSCAKVLSNYKSFCRDNHFINRFLIIKLVLCFFVKTAGMKVFRAGGDCGHFKYHAALCFSNKNAVSKSERWQ